MDFKDFKEAFSSANWSSMLHHFVEFFKRFYVFSFFYIWFGSPAYGIALLLPATLKLLDVSNEICDLLARILLTIAPVFPTLLLSKMKQDDHNDEFSMDFCFSSWLLTAVFAWKFL